LLATVNLFVDLLGAVCLLSLIIVTAKQKQVQITFYNLMVYQRSLHGICHLLIGLYAVASLLSKAIILLPYWLFLFDTTVSLLVCAIVELIPMLGQMDIFPIMLAIVVDRMLSVFFPLWFVKRWASIRVN
jgi:hypothetical protein